jgi:cytochrome oxidase Cu insertion factor (SCO1/SenC/PrrC family)
MRHISGTLALAGLVLAWMATAASAQAPPKGERPQIRQGNLNDGDAAPDFSLADVAGKTTVKLSSLKGKPVVLIFGSCTCPPFVGTTPATETLYSSYKDKVHFYIVYIREAHPTDGRAIPNNRFKVSTPRSLEERQKLAKDFAEQLKVSIPILVDSIEDPVEKTYSCWPNRMVILDAQGKIADKGTAGPGGVGGSAKRAAEVLDKLLADSK